MPDNSTLQIEIDRNKWNMPYLYSIANGYGEIIKIYVELNTIV